ncbi:MAG: hypothetical protein JXJ04_10810 [Spirochaetales bacterium]|nr:hypothetical protein [Spirochaetales bacterium]
MSSENLKNGIEAIWKSTEQNDCISHCVSFYKNLLLDVETIFKSREQEDLVNLFESISKKNHTFPFLLSVRYSGDIKKLSVLQRILSNINIALVSFVTHKFQKTEMQAAAFDQLLFFTERVDFTSELLFMNIIPEYLLRNRESLVPGDFNKGLLQMLTLAGSEFIPYLSIVKKIISEYERDFLSLTNYALYPLKDILFHYAQKAAAEEKYLFLYGWLSSYKNETISDFLLKTSIPPYLYPQFIHRQPSHNILTDIIRLLTTLSEKSCTEGLLSLEDALEDFVNDPVLKTGIQLIVDGTEHKLVKTLLTEKIKASMYLYKMKLNIIIQGLLSIYMGDNPRITEEILRSITMNIYTDELERLILQLINFSRKARMEGILVLEDLLPEVDSILLAEGIKCIVSGVYYDYAKILLTALSERLIEEKNLYYTIIISGIMHIASGTPVLVTEKHLKMMVPFYDNTDCIESVEKRKKQIDSICERLSNSENFEITKDDNLSHLYNLVSALITYKAEFMGLYIYYSSYFTDDKTVPDFRTLNAIFSENSMMAEKFLADNERIVTFTLPLSYKNELLASISRLEKNHSRHNAQLEEKIGSFSENLESMLTTTMIAVKKYEAEKNPSIENLSFLSEEEKIISFLKGLGNLHEKQSKKYSLLFSELAREFLTGITELSREIFSFVPDFSDIKETPYLSLTLILQIITKNDFLLSKIDTIFPDDIATLVRERLFTFNDIVYISDNGIKEILTRVSTRDLFLSLKSSDTYIRDKFYKNLTDSRLQELKESFESPVSVTEEDVRNARNKIIMYVFKLDEMPSYLAFRSMRGMSFIDTFTRTD